ncbi:MAG: hypothetical protein QXX03_05580 [Nitrososphaerota archaeon]
MLDLNKKVEERLLKLKKDIQDPFSASQAGYPGLEGYCRRKRLLNHFKPQNIEENQELQQIFLKGFFAELGYVQIIKDVVKERVFTKVQWKLRNGNQEIRVDPDIYIPSLNKIIEIKAIRRIPEKPIEMHRIQVGLQIEASPKKSSGEIHYIEFEGRKWNLAIFPVLRLTSDELKKIFEENEIVMKHWETKTIPDIPEGFSPYKYPCFYSRLSRCPHYDDCWLKEKGSIEIFIDDIDKYYLIKQKIRNLKKAIENLEKFAEKIEQFFPKEVGIYNVGNYELRIHYIPETEVPAYKRSAYYKYTIKMLKKEE